MMKGFQRTKGLRRFAGGAGILVMAALPPASPTAVSKEATCSTKLTPAKAAMIMAMVDSADSIVTYRVDPHLSWLAPGKPDTARKVGLFRIVSGVRTASAMDRKAIRDLILDPDAHHHHGKRCSFSPGVGIEFVYPDTSGHVLICFSCTQFMIGKGQVLGFAGGDFELTRRQFVELVQRLLPDDAELKTLELTTRRPPGH